MDKSLLCEWCSVPAAIAHCHNCSELRRLSQAIHNPLGLGTVSGLLLVGRVERALTGLWVANPPMCT